MVFTNPKWPGAVLTETEAKAKGIEVKVAKFPWAASGRAMTFDRTDGLTKLILEPDTDRILGVGIVGHGAGELIAEGVVAVEMGANAKDLAACVHPHPTLSETDHGSGGSLLRPRHARFHAQSGCEGIAHRQLPRKINGFHQASSFAPPVCAGRIMKSLSRWFVAESGTLRRSINRNFAHKISKIWMRHLLWLAPSNGSANATEVYQTSERDLEG